MQLRDLHDLVENTADAAFAIDPFGTIVAWNAAAEALFGLAAGEAIGRFCDEIVQGRDELGPVCRPQCGIQQAIRKGQPLGSYDLEAATLGGRRWCNVSVLIARLAGADKPYAIHIVRSVDTCKRWELLLRDVVVRTTGLPPERAASALAEIRSASQATDLSNREQQVLRLLAKGRTTADIAGELQLARATVNNHVQHILHKLGAHTRLEAVRRGELAGLI